MRGRTGRKKFKAADEAHKLRNRMQLLSLARGPTQNPDTLGRVARALAQEAERKKNSAAAAANPANTRLGTGDKRKKGETAQEIKSFEPMKVMVVEKLPDGQYAFFRTQHRVPPTSSITVTVEPIDGDPDLFLSTTHMRPTHDQNEFKSSGDGSDTIHVPPSDPPRDSFVYYYISVLAYGSETSFRLHYTIEHGNTNPWVDEDIWRQQLVHIVVDQRTSVVTTIDPHTGFNPVLVACAEGSSTALITLLQMGADLNFQTPFEECAYTPDWLALTNPDEESDAAPQSRSFGDNALTACVGMDFWGTPASGWRYQARMEVLAVLLERQPMIVDVADLESGRWRVPSIWEPRKVDGCNALHLAAANGSLEVSANVWCIFVSE